MAREIERKFLVKGDFLLGKHAKTPQWMEQGYVFDEGGLSCRVRIVKLPMAETKLCFKKKVSDIERVEIEFDIDRQRAEELLTICKGGIIEKKRWAVIGPDGKTWEVDVLMGDNEGLIVAEIELSDPEETFEKPLWLGDEVTSDSRYLNASLAKRPFKKWKSERRRPEGHGLRTGAE